MKPFLLALLILFTSFGYAQKRRNVYFLRNDGKPITTRDSADYIRIVEEPDSGSTLFNVFEYYKDDKKKLIGKSSTIDPLTFEGQRISYYHNGLKQHIINYSKGQQLGDAIDFYPNGKVYQVKEYFIDKSKNYYDLYSIKENYDSVGAVLVTNGNGIYRGFDDAFTYLNEQGKVTEGKRDGMWTGSAKKSKITYTENYENGKLIKGISIDSLGKTYTYSESRERMPKFKGGLDAFYKFLSHTIRYPSEDKKMGIQGRVVIQFVVNKDGTITDIKILTHVSPTIDAEAIRVLAASPTWVPGIQFGQVVRVYYTVPLSFKLSRD